MLSAKILCCLLNRQLAMLRDEIARVLEQGAAEALDAWGQDVGLLRRGQTLATIPAVVVSTAAGMSDAWGGAELKSTAEAHVRHIDLPVGVMIRQGDRLDVSGVLWLVTGIRADSYDNLIHLDLER